jgi:hypothetical protein
VSKGTTIVHAGRLWDGNSETLRTDVDIVIERQPHHGDPPARPGGCRRAAQVHRRHRRSP